MAVAELTDPGFRAIPEPEQVDGIVHLQCAF
jgi:hypothetical protein